MIGVGSLLVAEQAFSAGAPAPTVTAITPSTGTTAGGTSITDLHGTGFVSGATVTIGGVAATGVTFVSSVKLTCTTPAGTAGAQNVVVTNPDTQTSGTSGNGLFTYTAAVFDPATLALTGWWRASYAGAPWAATASAGISAATGSLVAGVAPATGTAQNGKTPADFDGTSHYLTNATGAASLFSTTNATIVALVRITAADAATGSTYDDAAIYTDSNADIGMTVIANGANVDIAGFAYDGAYRSKAVTVTKSAYHLIMMRTNGTVLGMRADSAAEVTALCGTKTVLTGTAYVGQGYLGTHKITGQVLELMTSDLDLSASYANIKSYVNARYALAL